MRDSSTPICCCPQFAGLLPLDPLLPVAPPPERRATPQPAGGRLRAAAHGDPGHVEIWSLADKRKLLDLPPHGTDAYCVEFHPDGTRLASGGSDNAIRLWDTTTWGPVLELRGHTSYVKAVVFSPDGTQLASGSGDLTVRIWDTIPRAERDRQAALARDR